MSKVFSTIFICLLLLSFFHIDFAFLICNIWLNVLAALERSCMQPDIYTVNFWKLPLKSCGAGSCSLSLFLTKKANRMLITIQLCLLSKPMCCFLISFLRFPVREYKYLVFFFFYFSSGVIIFFLFSSLQS